MQRITCFLLICIIVATIPNFGSSHFGSSHFGSSHGGFCHFGSSHLGSSYLGSRHFLAQTILSQVILDPWRRFFFFTQSVSQSVSQSVCRHPEDPPPTPNFAREDCRAGGMRPSRQAGRPAMAQAGCALLPDAPIPFGVDRADPRCSLFQNP